MTRLAVLILPFLVLQACNWLSRAPEPGVGDPVAWDRLQGWEADAQKAAWPALLASCSKIGEQPLWRDVCRKAREVADPTVTRARDFFESNFRPHPVYGEEGSREGLVTGYYEPLLRGSFQRTGPYQHALHAPPADLLRIDLGSVYPDLGERQLRGRLEGGRVVPYPDRERLESSPGELAGSELLWVDDPIDAFFLHVQGSGRVLLPDGRIVAVGFTDHNGRPYKSIGRRLIEAGELEREDVNLFSIRRWLREHPDSAATLLHHNPRYVFFRLRDDAGAGPVGSLNVPLTPGRSLAVDRDTVPLGAPVWLETSRPGQPETPFRRLMVAQDTGSAIKGYNRADVFWGLGEEAEHNAGLMKQPGRMFVLLPKEQ